VLAGVGVEVSDEGAVDLDHVDVGPLQITQG